MILNLSVNINGYDYPTQLGWAVDYAQAAKDRHGTNYEVKEVGKNIELREYTKPGYVTVSKFNKETGKRTSRAKTIELK